MAAHYKRIIANEIVNNAVSGGLVTTKNSQALVNGISKLIKVLPSKKKSDIIPQLAVKSSDLSKHVQGEPTLSMAKETISSYKMKDTVFFRIDPSRFAKAVLSDVTSDGSYYGYRDVSRPTECVCIEFSSPNIAKPFHVGHMRSTIIGNVLCNMYEAAGYDVKRVNFLGDWGTQFGLLTLGLQRYADREKLIEDPLKVFSEVYVRINKDVRMECGAQSETTSQTYQEGMELFSKLEKGDPELKSVWKEIRELSLMDLDKMYKRLGVYFTHVMAESDYQDKTEEILKCLRDQSLLQYDSNGVGYVNIEGLKDQGKASLVKSDGSSLYLTRDIGAAMERQSLFSCDRMHYVVEEGQRTHFVKLVNILKLLGVPWANRPIQDIHIHFGRVKGMSTRAGTSVLLHDLLEEARSRVEETMKNTSTTRVTDTFDEVTNVLAVSAIILQDLKDNRVYNYNFDWDRMLSFKTNSGVFAQYCHARLSNMMKNCGVKYTQQVDLDCIADDLTLHRVILHLACYPEVFEASLTALQPHQVVRYLFDLCHLVNAAYRVCPVKGQPLEVAQARLYVFAGAKQVLMNCFQLLGLQPLEQM